MAPIVKAPTARRNNPLTSGLRTQNRSAWGTGPKTNRARALQGATAAAATATALTMPTQAWGLEGEAPLYDLDCSDSYFAQSDVPCDVAKASLQKGIENPAIGAYRHGDLNDANIILEAMRVGVHEQVTVETLGQLVGADLTDNPYVADYVSPIIGIAATYLGLKIINSGTGYRLNPIDGSVIDEKSGMKWAFWWLAVIQASYIAGHNIGDLDLIFQQDGAHLENLIINRQLTQNNIIYWAYLAPVWAMVAFIPFQLSGPIFKVAMRKQTKRDEYIVSGGLQKLEPGVFKRLTKTDESTGNQSLSVSVPLEKLTKGKHQKTIAKLPEHIGAEATYKVANVDDFLKSRPLLAKAAQATGFDATVSYTTVYKAEEEWVTEGSLRKGTRFFAEHSEALADQIKAGKVFRSRRHIGQFVVANQPVDVADLGGAAHVKKGSFSQSGQFGIAGDEWKAHLQNFGPQKKRFRTINEGVTSFSVKFEGQAAKVLDVVPKIIGGEHLIDLMPRFIDNEPMRAARRFLRRIKPRNISIKLVGQGVDQIDEGDLASIFADKKFVSKRTSEPTVRINRGALEKYYASVDKNQVRVAVDPTVAFELARIVKEATGEELEFTAFNDYNTVKGFVGFKTKKLETVISADFFRGIFGDNYDANHPAIKLISDGFTNQAVKLIIPNPLQDPKSVGSLHAVEEKAIVTPAGSNIPLHEVELPDENPDLARGFFSSKATSLSVLGSSLYQGNSNGRARALLAIAFGGAIASGSTAGLTKYMQGYDPATALMTAPRSLFTRSLNMVSAPALIQSFGIEKYSNYMYYSPGMHYMYLIHMPVNDFINGEGAPMMAQNYIIQTRGDGRADVRAENLTKLGSMEERVSEAKQTKVLAKKMAHFAANGMVRTDDTTLIRGYYEAGLAMSDVEESDMMTARLIASVAYDPALTWIIKEHDPALFEQFKADRVRLGGQIQKVLAEFKLTTADLEDWG